MIIALIPLLFAIGGLAILQPGSHVTFCGALRLKRAGSLTARHPWVFGTGACML